ncbi:MAG: glycosyltransferase [Gemmatimonadales bacterium]
MPVADLPRPWSDRAGDVVVVGRLTPQKRIHLALEAMAIARARDLGRCLVIVGDGPSRAALERLAGSLQLGNAVRFVGEVAPEAVPEYFEHAVCCLMPADGEGFGLAAAEALMQGVPVVACRDGGGLVDLVPTNGAGRVVAPDGNSIALALEELTSDPGAGPAARVAGAEWRSRLTPDFVAERCMNWYQRALHA